MSANITTTDAAPGSVVTFYKFVHLSDYRDLRAPLLAACRQNKIKGTILLAEEGINGTIAGSLEGITAVFNYLHSNAHLSDLMYKESVMDDVPFYRMKVKIKKEIVTMGVPVDPRHASGIRLDAKAWNELISDPEVLVIDTRNQYEYDVGTFKGSISPHTTAFTEFPEYVRTQLASYKDRKIAMFCTGGIRCEKATSYLLGEGFEQVFHLNGGILKYLQDVAPDDNRWQGECFVFDGRVALDKNLRTGTHVLCYGCRMPVSAEDRMSAKYEAGVSCPHCYDQLTGERRAGLQERQYQMKLAQERKSTHIGEPQHQD